MADSNSSYPDIFSRLIALVLSNSDYQAIKILYQRVPGVKGRATLSTSSMSAYIRFSLSYFRDVPMMCEKPLRYPMILWMRR
jgi:hypothetical protein